MRSRIAASVLISGFLQLVASTAGAQDDVAALEKQRCPKPAQVALVFSNGYGGDDMPKDDAQFEKLLLKIKEAGFNVIHCTYTDKRLAACKKHGIQMMVHLLAEEHHVYKSPDKAQAVCEKLRNNPDVWGYNIWNDVFRKTGEGRRRDINTVRRWDPTHPAYSGTYRTDGMSHLVNADVIGYYDFHWKRGIEQHFSHLLAYSRWAKERDAWFCSWLAVTSGQAGKGNFNRSLWSANTGLAFGQKGILWFLGTEMMNPKTLEWTEAGRDIGKVNLEIAPLAREMARLGNPVAIYSTPITKTPNNTALPGGTKETMPPALDKLSFVKDVRIQPVAGEFVMGVFNDGKRDYQFLANHNAYAEQDVKLKLTHPLKLSLFDRKTRQWSALQADGGIVSITLTPGGGELLRVGE